MRWIYLSPHLDDAVFSCGGLIWARAQAGDQVEVWTLFAGDPPPGEFSRFARSLHKRWGLDREVAVYRRAEDRAACAELGASALAFEYPDAIYRRHPEKDKPLYRSNRALFGSLQAADKRLVEDIAAKLSERLPQGVAIVCPLTLGNHVDHQLTRLAAERLGGDLRYYADLPYVLEAGAIPAAKLDQGMRVETYPVSEAALRAWGNAAAAYASQVSSFWSDEHAMRQALEKYLNQNSGLRLWVRPSPSS